MGEPGDGWRWRRGRGSPSVVHEVVHTTVNADGTVTSDFANVTAACG